LPVRNKKLRHSQTVSPFGVGAIIDLMKESFIVCDTNKWIEFQRGRQLKKIIHDPFAKTLGVSDFRSAPVMDRNRIRNKLRITTLPVKRFPSWLFCAKCRKMQEWNNENELRMEKPECNDCDGGINLLPMRFIIVCEDGHIGDVPWRWWAHSDPENREPGKCYDGDLFFNDDPKLGGGLRSLEVRCDACGASRDLSNITVNNVLRSIGEDCPGIHPWEYQPEPNCEKIPQVVQRGASNVYFPIVSSALDIHNYEDETDSKIEEIRKNPIFSLLITGHGNEEFSSGLKSQIAKDLQCDVSLVEKVCENEQGGHVQSHKEIDLESQEYHAFFSNQNEMYSGEKFITEKVALNISQDHHEKIVALIDEIIIAKKLKEIRALRGFTRLDPENRIVKPSLDDEQDWLPAIEVYGEGIFISFKEKRLQKWEKEMEVTKRSRIIAERVPDSLFARYFPSQISPRFIMMHTFAHLLIKELSYRCGYSSASLREKIYSRILENGGESFGAILIYTADGDSEGSLGGLARMGKYPMIINNVLESFRKAEWCSMDPICKESTGQGFQNLNLAGCHACTLLSETSCVYMNSLLDRGLVLGTVLNKDLGFFSGTNETR